MSHFTESSKPADRLSELESFVQHVAGMHCPGDIIDYFSEEGERLEGEVVRFDGEIAIETVYAIIHLARKVAGDNYWVPKHFL